jgi:hypothetical protein
VTGGLLEAFANPSDLISFLRSQYDPFAARWTAELQGDLRQTSAMFNREPEIDLETLAEFTTPTLVLQRGPGRGDP